jgi:hypothetical protein
MLLSISEISKLTGRDRRTVTKKLENFPHEQGEKGAHLYKSTDALAAVYAADSLEAARAEQARSQAALNKVREEELRKQRIPIDLVLSIHDQTLQAMVATLKAAKDKTLTADLINELLGKFREIPAKLKW